MNYNPTGTWSGWYCSEIIRAAVSEGIRVDEHYGYEFNKIENLFNDYVNEFYK